MAYAEIIGGADGPTAVYLCGAPSWIPNTWLGAIIVLAALGLMAYFIGNISPSTIMAKKRGIDIKKVGSGNAGTTNALRAMGKKAGAITCIVDILKGVVAVLIGTFIAGPLGASICGLMVYLGHVWPIIYKFQGGKGVATAFGAVLAVNPLDAVICLALTAAVVFISKRMSLGSIIGAIVLPIITFFMVPWYAATTLIMGIIIIIKHRANIGRLIRGEEPIMSIFEKGNKGSVVNGTADLDKDTVEATSVDSDAADINATDVENAEEAGGVTVASIDTGINSTVTDTSREVKKEPSKEDE